MPIFKSLVWLDPEKIPSQAGFEPGIFRSRGGLLNHKANKAVTVHTEAPSAHSAPSLSLAIEEVILFLIRHEQADELAREGGQLDQEDRYTSYTDEKTAIKTLSKKKWKQQHPNSNQSDSLHKLNRPEQVILFRQRTGHNRLNAHKYSKFKVGEWYVPMQRRHRNSRTSTAALPTTWCFEAGRVARTNTTEGQDLWQPGEAEADSRFRESDRHLRLAYDDK